MPGVGRLPGHAEPPDTLGGCHIENCCRHMDNRLFTHVSEIQYPPKEKTPKGRLNREIDPILYAAFTRAAALTESKVTPGQIVAMAIIKDLDDHQNRVQFFPIGIPSGRYATPVRNTAERNVPDYLNREIIKVVNKGNEHEYNPTIAIADNFLRNPVLRPREGVSLDAGLIYPSARSGQPLNESTYNIAVIPEVFHAHYQIAEVEAWYLTTLDAGSLVNCYNINSATLNPDGSLQWRHSTYEEMAEHCFARSGHYPIRCSL